MSTLWSTLQVRPVAVQTAVLSVFGVLSAFHILTLTSEQTGTLTTALALVLGLFVRQNVTPAANVPKQSPMPPMPPTVGGP